jgi:hypothetical protein
MTNKERALSKVPAITLGFWIIKVLATTLGETGGDTVSMSWLGETTPEAGQGGLNGYLVGTAIFGVALIVLVWAQVRARGFNPLAVLGHDHRFDDLRDHACGLPHALVRFGLSRRLAFAARLRARVLVCLAPDAWQRRREQDRHA